MSEMNGRGKSFLLGALIGSIAGSVTALFYAPKSGRELREDIAGQYQAVSEKTQNMIQNVKEQSSQLAARAHDSVISAIDEWKSAKAQAQEAADLTQAADKQQESSAS